MSEMTHVAAHMSEMTHVAAHVSEMSAAVTAAAMTAAMAR
jgi:hypothetical protein